MSSNYDYVVGSVRQSQALYTYGAGAIADLIGGSFMPLGLDVQEIRRRMIGHGVHQLELSEPRLARALEVSKFYKPPVADKDSLDPLGKHVKRCWGVPVVRFPEWLECPECHRLGTVNNPFEISPEENIRCQKCDKRVSPVRFISVCPHGHIDDFPWEWWAHLECPEPYSRDRRHSLYLRSHGRSASLSDLYIECKECNCRKSLGGIFELGALQKVGSKCRGRRPWLGIHERETCKEPNGLRVVQRGGSNVYFPIIASMLSIPPASDALTSTLERFWTSLSPLSESELPMVLEALIRPYGISLEQALAWVKQYRKFTEAEGEADDTSSRHEEFLALGMTNYADTVSGQTGEFQTRVLDVVGDMSKIVTGLTVVERLREVRALCGFSRITPVSVKTENIRDALDNGAISAISKSRKDWFPAIEVRGEGIFFQLDFSAIEAWADSKTWVKKRIEKLQKIQETINQERGETDTHVITAPLLITHSLSHAVIRRLSLECGYSIASIRERLYVSEPDDDFKMAGFLVYTGSPDSDGSLGGLVGLAHSSRLERILMDSLDDCNWCANDPVCSERTPEIGGDRLSGACCHGCLLLPETSCERYNRELDRILLTGTADDEFPGYFSSIMV